MGDGLFVKAYRSLIAPMVRRRTRGKADFVPRVIVPLDGGLGSQMWQYALGRGAGLRSQLAVLYDMGWYERYGRDIDNRHDRWYELDRVFPDIPVPQADPDLLRFYKLNFFYRRPKEKTFLYDEWVFTSKAPRYMAGYYMNASYIDRQGDALREEFAFRLELSDDNRFIFQRIYEEVHPVAVHIRRGDYVGSGLDVATAAYFRRAVRRMSERLQPERAFYFVFSNGMAWSKEVLGDLGEEMIFVENNGNREGAVDMYLMSRCRHFVISNSSFGWWPAWLQRNREKIVIMPDRWTPRERPEDRHAMRVDGWTPMAVD